MAEAKPRKMYKNAYLLLASVPIFVSNNQSFVSHVPQSTFAGQSRQNRENSVASNVSCDCKFSLAAVSLVP